MADNMKPEVVKEQEESTSDTVLSMIDVLEEEKQLEDDANAVLGGSDDKNCTYPLGAIPRQALYSCSTCCQDGEPAGVCLACSIECHDGHELFELYTKRNFQCDCGNSKFPATFQCKLYKDKKSVNTSNEYNQNFKGVYCTCNRPYPDHEDEVDDDMIQCIVCEDWYHSRHLGTPVPNQDFHEMICDKCMELSDFLFYYNFISEVTVMKSESGETVDVDNPGQETNSQHTETPSGSSDSASPKMEPNDVKVDSKNESVTSDQDDKSDCKLLELKKGKTLTKTTGATFWAEGWRQKLCKCCECMKMYEEKKIVYLSEDADSVQTYEQQGLKNSTSRYDRGMQAFSGMDRVQQVEVLHGYNDLKTELKDYLKKFAENGKVVREEDIKEFFEGMQARKKQKVEIPYSCR